MRAGSPYGASSKVGQDYRALRLRPMVTLAVFLQHAEVDALLPTVKCIEHAGGKRASRFRFAVSDRQSEAGQVTP